MFELLKYGVINVYVFFLLEYCGGVFVYYVLFDGKMEIGVMIMYMVEKLDVGDMIS